MGGVQGGGGWAVGGTSKPSLGLFGLGRIPRSAIHRPNQAQRA